ncbi:hypothetical protein PsorP6_000616 [Peronosclerospora sorghi]|uniref:Uncharacterized protein n=1 Tax=Peronosclerospora sorghi TaxID=230839 RepID=A0ACC0WS62_9STRA|nr:hypothetical protein PsorP6_000616 [Peronosclerospora sorghi]
MVCGKSYVPHSSGDRSDGFTNFFSHYASRVLSICFRAEPSRELQIATLRNPRRIFHALGERLIAAPGSQQPSGDGTSDSNSNFQVQKKEA